MPPKTPAQLDREIAQALQEAEPSSRPVEHIRATGEMRADKRFRSQLGYGPKSRSIANRSRTLCGAEPTKEDVDRKHAKHVLSFRAIKPEWSADLCPACVERLDD